MKVLGCLLVSVFLVSFACLSAERPSAVTWEGKQIEGIIDVHIASGGKIIVIHRSGGFSTTEDKLPSDFLRAWGITAENVTSAQESRAKAAADDFERALRSGLFREVDGIVYDLRKPHPDWVLLSKVRVLQVVPRGAICDLKPDEGQPTPIFVRNLPGTIGDTDTLNITAKLSGSFSYVNAFGYHRTIRSYDMGRPCRRDEIPDAIRSDGKLWAKVVGGKQERDLMARLPESDDISASGTGFFISEDGYLLTNSHVIQDAKRIKVKTAEGLFKADVVKSDPEKDLALLKVEGRFKALPIIDDTPAVLGQPVFTIGFPNVEVQGLEPKYTDGKISSLSGLHDDPNQYQVSVPVQPGNSGGPLMSRSGKVVGIVEAKLNDLRMLVSSGNLPQNVNYAIKTKVVREFLATIPGLHTMSPAETLNEDQAVKATTDAVAIVLVY
jgi:S1-C subfamily serine protease